MAVQDVREKNRKDLTDSCDDWDVIHESFKIVYLTHDEETHPRCVAHHKNGAIFSYPQTPHCNAHEINH